MRMTTFVVLAALFTAPLAGAAVLEVGPQKPFRSIQAALNAARNGDEISVFTTRKSTFYDKTAVFVRTPGLHIHAADANEPITINGASLNYANSQRIPRAIFQFEPTASGCTLEGFDLSGAHNNSHNGAGVRINAANNITIRHCTIHANDMGIMSNGDLRNHTGENQLIEFCLIGKNGNFKEPGQNHNLYLGGTSVTVRGCEIAFSLTGHNLKSRAHQSWIEYNYIHDSAARELDLVDAEGNTDAPHSDAVVLGNIIKKADRMRGNRNLIHFGKDGKANHTGTLWLIHNTITSEYPEPVVELSAPGASVAIIDNLFHRHANEKWTLATLRGGARESAIRSAGNVYETDQTRNEGLAKGNELVPWDKLEPLWKIFGKKPEPLMAYGGHLTIVARHEFKAGAAGKVP